MAAEWAAIQALAQNWSSDTREVLGASDLSGDGTHDIAEGDGRVLRSPALIIRRPDRDRRKTSKFGRAAAPFRELKDGDRMTVMEVGGEPKLRS